MFTKLAISLVLATTVSVFDGKSITVALDNSVAAPVCCMKHAYCCSVHKDCCKTGLSDTVAANLVAEPVCCIKRSYCCSVKNSCCHRANLIDNIG